MFTCESERGVGGLVMEVEEEVGGCDCEGGACEMGSGALVVVVVVVVEEMGGVEGTGAGAGLAEGLP